MIGKLFKKNDKFKYLGKVRIVEDTDLEIHYQTGFKRQYIKFTSKGKQQWLDSLDVDKA